MRPLSAPAPPACLLPGLLSTWQEYRGFNRNQKRHRNVAGSQVIWNTSLWENEHKQNEPGMGWDCPLANYELGT